MNQLMVYCYRTAVAIGFNLKWTRKAYLSPSELIEKVRLELNCENRGVSYTKDDCLFGGSRFQLERVRQ